MSQQRRPSRRRLPASQEALHEMALAYLERFPTTSARLRRYLDGKVKEAVQQARCDHAVAAGWTQSVVARLTRVGLLDDARYAALRAGALHRRGRSLRFIRQDLRGRGVPDELVGPALEELKAESEGDLELSAAVTHARRRRLGPFARAEQRRDRRQRHLAALARAGFSFDVARTVIDAPDADALLEMR